MDRFTKTSKPLGGPGVVYVCKDEYVGKMGSFTSEGEDHVVDEAARFSGGPEKIDDTFKGSTSNPGID